MEKYKFEVGDVRATELVKMPTDPQTSSNIPENTSDNVDEYMGMSVNMIDTLSTFIAQKCRVRKLLRKLIKI